MNLSQFAGGAGSRVCAGWDDANPKSYFSPNQMFSSVEGKENISQVDVEQMISWVNGLYCFNSADLGIVLKRLSTYYGINVEFDSALSK